jgi:hypothetical protein
MIGLRLCGPSDGGRGIGRTAPILGVDLLQDLVDGLLDRPFDARDQEDRRRALGLIPGRPDRNDVVRVDVDAGTGIVGQLDALPYGPCSPVVRVIGPLRRRSIMPGTDATGDDVTDVSNGLFRHPPPRSNTTWPGRSSPSYSMTWRLRRGRMVRSGMRKDPATPARGALVVAEAIELCITSEGLIRDAILARARAVIAVRRSRERRDRMARGADPTRETSP